MIKIEKYINKYKHKLKLDDCDIDIAISDDEHYFSAKNNKIEKVQSDYYAEAVRTGYKQYTILLNRSTFNKNLQQTILHELLHVMFWEMLEVAEQMIDFTKFSEETKIGLYDKLLGKEHEVIQTLEILLK